MRSIRFAGTLVAAAYFALSWAGSVSASSSTPADGDLAPWAAANLFNECSLGPQDQPQACSCPRSPITGKICTGDGSTPMPNSLLVYVYLNGAPWWTYNAPLCTNTELCLQGPQAPPDWEFTFAAGGGGYYFNTPRKPGATCPPRDPPNCCDLGNCPPCRGGFDLTLYSDRGSFHGIVVSLPSGEPVTSGTVAAQAVPPHVSEIVGGPILPDGTFQLYRYYYDQVGNNWSVKVWGDGDGPGTGDYYLYVDVNSKTQATTKSNENPDVTVYVKSPQMEETSIRPQANQGGPSGGGCDPGEPVSVVTGNMYFDHRDATVPGVSTTLDLTRSYNSLNRGSGQYGAFGMGWSHSYEKRLTVPEPKVLALREGNGVIHYFQDNNQDLKYEASVPYTKSNWIQKQGDGSYVRQYRNGSREVYTSAGRLASLVDALENTTTLTYDAVGRLTTITAPGGRALVLGYTGSLTQPDTLIGPGGTIATYTYENGKLKTVRYADGPDENVEPDGGYTFTYDASDRLTVAQDADGKAIETHAYLSGGIAETSEVSNGIERYVFSYNEDALTTTVTDALGNVTQYHWNNIYGRRLVTKIEGSCSSCGGGSEVREWTYDDKGRVLTYKDGAGNVTTYIYDPDTGDVLTESRVADPDSPATTTHTTTYTYYLEGAPNYGRMHTKTEPNGQLTTHTYVAAGPETITEAVTATETRTTSFTYTAQGQVQTVTNPLLKVTEFHYTALGDLEWVEDPMDHHTSFEYDLMGRRTRTTRPVTTPPNAEPTTTYDTLGRVYRITNPDNSYTEFTYDGDGHRTRVRDFLGRPTNYVYDAYGRLEKVTDVDGKETVYGYDLMSHLTSITDARGKTTGFQVDAFGRVTKVTYPGPRYEEFTYDGAGRLETKKDRKGVTTTYTYDGLGRLTQKAYDNGAPAVTFTYDQGPTDHKGRLTTAANASDTLTWTYDLAAQVKFEDSAFNGTHVGYTHDLAGNRLTSILGVRTLTYDYDDDGKLWHLTWGSGTYTFGYDDAHRRRSLTYPNGAVTTYTPDLLSRLEAVGTTVGGNPVIQTTHTYDAMGNRLTRGGGEFTLGYEYDNVYRLTAANALPPPPCPGCPPQPPEPWEGYGYDAVGNRTGTVFSRFEWTYSDRNELLSTGGGSTFTYDLNGNMATRSEGADNWTYEWSVENELTRVVKNGTEIATFKYDALGRRIEKVAGGVTKRFTYDGEDILRERIVGVKNLRYVHGPGIDEPLGSEELNPGTLTYYHADALGSIVKVTDATGAVTLTRTYDSFGIPTDSATTPGYAFTGREWDPETGFYYYRARYYDPKIGRFLSEDPIAVPRRDTRELNPYAYVANNPVNETDPSGLAIWLCNRKAFTRFGPGNHTYFWDDRNGRCCGRGSQLKCNEAGPTTDSCRKVEGSDGHEHKILACCRYNDWGTFRPISNDCHVTTNTCLAITGMKNPGAPGDRFGPPCDPCSK